MIDIVYTKVAKEFAPVLTGLEEEFESQLYPYVLTWCGILPPDESDKDKFWRVWLIRYCGQIVGICGLYAIDDSDELWLGWFGILKEFRNKKIGGEVLRFIKVAAKAQKSTKLYVYASEEDAIRFYLKHGFTKFGTVKQYAKKFPNNREYLGSDTDTVLFKNI